MRHKGLFLLKNKKIVLVKGTEYFKRTDQSIIKVFKEKEVVFLVTRGDGIFTLHNNKIKKIDIKNYFLTDLQCTVAKNLKMEIMLLEPLMDYLFLISIST